ncbi:MAG TPA: hypothetical protein VG961_04985 [Ignavibacteria bacterium]|nr:hypothetical protein [Ignavibacteria bacterium]
MRTSDDLFQLIKSMSKSEKGYFKKFASKHTIGEKNTYVRLFDAIDALSEYDEAQIKMKFKGEKFAEKLYSTKNYLFNLILKALSSYHAEKFAVSKLNMMMIELNVLFEKGLYKQFRTLLNKAISMARENDKPFYLALLYNKALTSLATDYYANFDEMDYASLIKDTLENLKNLSINEQYHIIYNDMFMFTKETGNIRNERDLERLNSIVNNQLMQDVSFAKTFDSKFKFYTVLGHYYRIIDDRPQWLKYRKELVLLMESDKKYIRENPRSYVLALNNYLHACVITGKNSEFEIYMKKLKLFSKQFENKKEFLDIQSRIFLLTSDLELNYAIRSLKTDNLRSITGSIETGFEKYKKSISENRKLSIYNRMAYAYFLMKDFDKCIFYLNRILNVSNPKIDPEQNIFARIRSLIVHFEAGNYDLLEYTVKSTRRFLERTNRIFKFEKLILDFITRAMNYSSDDQRYGLYEELKYSIEKISNDKFEKNILEQFDFVSWIESKLAHTGMLNILKKKAV